MNTLSLRLLFTVALLFVAFFELAESSDLDLAGKKSAGKTKSVKKVKSKSYNQKVKKVKSSPKLNFSSGPSLEPTSAPTTEPTIEPTQTAETTVAPSFIKGINLPDSYSGYPNPSMKLYSGIDCSNVASIDIQIKKFSHTNPNDVGLTVVNPDSNSVKSCTLIQFVATANNPDDIIDIDITFSDSGATKFADHNPATSGSTYSPNLGTLASLIDDKCNGVWKLSASKATTGNGATGSIGDWEVIFNMIAD